MEVPLMESKKWIIADTHFNDRGIIEYESRPFTDQDEMTKEIIYRWNQLVSKEDAVYHLGDFGFGTQEEITEIVHKLNGKICLIKGNHDRDSSDKWWLDTGICKVYAFPILMAKFFILSHEPTFVNPLMPYINLHGHIHNQLRQDIQRVNCCCERHNYMPINLDSIIERFRALNRYSEAA